MIELWDRVLLVISPHIKTSSLQVDQDHPINIKGPCYRGVMGGAFDARIDPLPSSTNFYPMNMMF